ncbi:type II toxin-antitoxin system Phd/YefM family antitoxin [Oleomonas cavernae]|uniref:Type II toxin-antitoxin system Phd/YefM family antitoxin n=1 Tax=Oleomonas cavernae TaxID=2320859 RepID=A0A418W9M9_9PROT|nr:type II toxin-antitoxin system Phd/YefM family antitoxin [Oleomonas cavernae]RJF86689.1 type II toxin-antitoxin system Phd/YefM family antitoxin [Oleomonas cavernae]
MKTFSTVDLLKDLRTVIFAAAKSPVSITQYRKPRFVLMTVEDYERITNRDPRKAYAIEETPDELRAFMLGEIDKVLGDDDAP